MSAKTRKLVFTALFAALTTAFTLISIPLATGYFNFGDTIIFMASILMGPIYGAIVGAIGGALGDLILGYIAYAPFTLIIKALEGVIVGLLFITVQKFCKGKKSSELTEEILTLPINLLAGCVMALGYFLAEGLLLSDARWSGGLVQLPFNILQGVISAIVAIILLYPFRLKKIFCRYFYRNANMKESQNTLCADDKKDCEKDNSESDENEVDDERK